MKSGLEKYCNKRLTEEGFDFEYEGTSFEILPPSNHSFPLRFKLFLSYLTTRGMGDWSIFLIKNQKQVDTAIEIIKNGGKKT